MKKAVFFDRDGVLNQAVVRAGKPYPPADASSLVIDPAAPQIIRRLHDAGFLCLCVTNQPDLARGTRTEENIRSMNEKVRRGLGLDDLFVCLHDDGDRCGCRKPEPGLILAAAEKWNVDLKNSWMVGDRNSDVEAGRRAGCRTIFIDRGYAEGGPEKTASAVVKNIDDAAEIILGGHASAPMPPAAILAGGLATRMRPLTLKSPKILLEVAGQPFVDHQLRLLKENGFSRVVLCLGHLGEQVEERVGDGSAFGLKVSYSYDGQTLRGTAGALKKALPLLGEEFCVIYGDSYLQCDYGRIWQAYLRSGRPALMTVYRNRNQYERSNAVYQNGRVELYSKTADGPQMDYIDYGLGILRSGLLAELPADRPQDLAAVYEKLAAAGQLAGFEIFERFYEIGSPAGLAELHALLSVRAT